MEWKPSSSGTWNTLAQHPLNYTYSWQNESWNLPAEAGDTQIDIRFTGVTNYTDEYAMLDNVNISYSETPTPVCMPDDNEGTDFFQENWDYTDYRWRLRWNFSDYPDSYDDVWDGGNFCGTFQYADYNPYILLAPGETLEVTFQADVDLSASGSYYNEVYVLIDPGYYYFDDDEWLYSWPTGGVTVPQYDLQAETLNSLLRANASLSPDGFWWRSWHWWWHW